jgi:TonB family protein
MGPCRSQAACLLLGAATLTFHPTAAYPGAPTPTARVIPGRIIESGRKYLIERVGRDFFEKYITLDSDHCYLSPVTVNAGHPSVRSIAGRADNAEAAPAQPPVRLPRLGGNSPRWALEYKLAVPSKPWVKGNVSFEVDSAGAWAGGVGFYGVSDCVHHPEECTFSIEREWAVETARHARFGVGLKEWTVQFQWQAVVQPSSYAWVISNTLYLGPDGCSGSGQSLIVDASTGKILTTTNLSWICDFIASAPQFPAESEFVYHEDAPVPVVHEQPQYPEAAHEAGIQGLVLLHVLVGTDGRVKSVKVIRGVTGLNEAAIEAAKKWVFKPALSNNKPVAIWIEVPFRFPP